MAAVRAALQTATVMQTVICLKIAAVTFQAIVKSEVTVTTIDVHNNY
jgi:hypothetical protein